MMKNIRKILLPVVIVLTMALALFVGIMIQRQIDKANATEIDSGILFQEVCGDNQCYAIGHKSPDTDTVCSAILLAELLNEYGINCEARVSGKLNNETKLVLDIAKIDAPKIMERADGKKILLVDHSEYSQMVDGMKNAEIVGIFDHHAVGNVETDAPIIYEALNVGSTATIIYKIMKDDGLRIEKRAAILIASAILSDTNNMTSSTVTELDCCALKETAKIAGIANIDAFYEKMKLASESYEGMSDEEILLSDYKEYNMSGTTVGIACVNASDRYNAEELQERMRNVIEKIFEKLGVNQLFVLVKNSKDNQSTIMGYGDGAIDVLKQAFGSDDYIFRPAASRKKDVVPALEKIYASMQNEK